MRLIGGLAAASLLAISGCSTGADIGQAPPAMGARQCASIDAAMLGAIAARATWIEADAESGL
ncbi:MAG TPA: hypothetical protein VLA37_05740, partial [Sphingomonadaceae bacterium]|nr:hypothetical protein [Sphingomonadaceae bacterium]